MDPYKDVWIRSFNFLVDWIKSFLFICNFDKENGLIWKMSFEYLVFDQCSHCTLLLHLLYVVLIDFEFGKETHTIPGCSPIPVLFFEFFTRTAFNLKPMKCVHTLHIPSTGRNYIPLPGNLVVAFPFSWEKVSSSDKHWDTNFLKTMSWPSRLFPALCAWPVRQVKRSSPFPFRVH